MKTYIKIGSHKVYNKDIDYLLLKVQNINLAWDPLNRFYYNNFSIGGSVKDNVDQVPKFCFQKVLLFNKNMVLECIKEQGNKVYGHA